MRTCPQQATALWPCCPSANAKGVPVPFQPQIQRLPGQLAQRDSTSLRNNGKLDVAFLGQRDLNHGLALPPVIGFAGRCPAGAVGWGRCLIDSGIRCPGLMWGGCTRSTVAAVPRKAFRQAILLRQSFGVDVQVSKGGGSSSHVSRPPCRMWPFPG